MRKILVIAVLASLSACSHDKVDLKKVKYEAGCSGCTILVTYMRADGQKVNASEQGSFSYEFTTDNPNYYLKVSKDCPSILNARVWIDQELKEDYCPAGNCTLELKP